MKPGLHINALTGAHLGYIQQVRPDVNLLLDPKPEHVAQVKGSSPGSLLIGRPHVPNSDLHSRYLGGEQQARDAARWAADICLREAATMPQINAWLVLNEPPVGTVRQVELLAIFDSEFARLMYSAGKYACIGAFARGTPQVPQLDGGAALSAYRPAFLAAKETGALLVIHQYGIRQPLSFEAEWHACRWQRRIIPWLQANGIPVPHYVVAETGLDRGTGTPPDGWRAPGELGGYGDNEQGQAAYASDLQWLMNEYAKDSRCLGACIYCAGDNGDSRWHSFMVDGPLLTRLSQVQWPRLGSTPAPLPIPTPQPTPTPAPPKEDDVNLPSWVKVERAIGEPGENVWRLVKAVYLPPEGEGTPNSQGRHHIDIMEPHDASRRVAVMNKQTGEMWQLPLDKPISEPAQNHPMYGEPNSYTVFMTGAASDVVSGLVMKGNRHVTYQLWFELVKIAQPTPTPETPMPTPVPEPSLAETAFKVVEGKQVIVPTFALPKAILAHNARLGDNAKGYEFASGEVTFKWNKANYVALLAILPNTGEKLVAVAKKDEWAKIWLFKKLTSGQILEVTPQGISAPEKPLHTWSPSPNFHPRPAGMDINTIVWHHTAGGFQSSLNWLRNPTSGVSCHYLISKAGLIHQLVADANAAWHAGLSRMPDGRENVNNFSIGLEIENLGNGRDPYPSAQINALVDLLKWLVYRYNIKRSGHVSHELIRTLWNQAHPNNQAGKKSDPAGLDIQRILDRVYI